MTQSDTLTSALAQVQQRIAEAMSEIAPLDARLSELRATLRDARLEERVLKDIMERFGMVPNTVEEPERPPHERATTGSLAFKLGENDWTWKPRTDAVSEAVAHLTNTQGYATPLSIQEFLNTRNREESRDLIGAALSYLRTADRVENVARGQWVSAKGVHTP